MFDLKNQANLKQTEKKRNEDGKRKTMKKIGNTLILGQKRKLGKTNRNYKEVVETNMESTELILHSHSVTPQRCAPTGLSNLSNHC